MSPALYAVPMAREEPVKYRRIADDLRARMASGEFPPDSLLPSKRQMEEHYGVALATVNNAIAILRAAGLAETVHGVGTFARKAPDTGPSDYDRVMARLDQVDETVRQLEERLAAVEREQPQ